MQDAKKQYEKLTKRDISVVVMEPVRGGMLANVNKEAEDTLKAVRADKSIASWALRYVGTLDNVKVILSGMSTMEHVEDNLQTFKDFKKLDEEELKLVEEVADELKARTQNGCTGCAYCMPCPFGVNIPNNFRYWNTAYIYEDHDKFKAKLLAMGDSAADKCKQCGKCEKMCPQQLPIREHLKKIVEYTKE